MSKFTEYSNLIITATENYQKKDSLKLDNPQTSQSSPVEIFSTLTFFLTKQRNKSLNQNKANYWDNVSIIMIQLHAKTILKPLKYLFELSLTVLLYQKTGEKAALFQTVEKKSKNYLKNYIPNSLLSILTKMLERLFSIFI